MSLSRPQKYLYPKSPRQLRHNSLGNSMAAVCEAQQTFSNLHEQTRQTVGRVAFLFSISSSLCRPPVSRSLAFQFSPGREGRTCNACSSKMLCTPCKNTFMHEGYCKFSSWNTYCKSLEHGGTFWKAIYPQTLSQLETSSLLSQTCSGKKTCGEWLFQGWDWSWELSMLSNHCYKAVFLPFCTHEYVNNVFSNLSHLILFLLKLATFSNHLHSPLPHVLHGRD